MERCCGNVVFLFQVKEFTSYCLFDSLIEFFWLQVAEEILNSIIMEHLPGIRLAIEVNFIVTMYHVASTIK
jgi:hypothetical protein